MMHMKTNNTESHVCTSALVQIAKLTELHCLHIVADYVQVQILHTVLTIMKPALSCIMSRVLM